MLQLVRGFSRLAGLLVLAGWMIRELFRGFAVFLRAYGYAGFNKLNGLRFLVVWQE